VHNFFDFSSSATDMLTKYLDVAGEFFDFLPWSASIKRTRIDPVKLLNIPLDIL
jgi:hypothetical protein